jgi:hypothetical protein
MTWNMGDLPFNLTRECNDHILAHLRDTLPRDVLSSLSNPPKRNTPSQQKDDHKCEVVSVIEDHRDSLRLVSIPGSKQTK